MSASHDQHQEHIAPLQSDEEVKVRVVVNSDAVVHPHAMMVEALNALITLVAVAGIGRANELTRWAKQVRLEFLDEAHEWNFIRSSHITRFRPYCEAEKDRCSEEKCRQQREPNVTHDVGEDK